MNTPGLYAYLCSRPVREDLRPVLFRNAPTLRSVDSGLHRYETREPVRWRVVEYEPKAGNYGVQVEGTGDWKVVAIPVYDLILETQIQPIKQGDRCSPGKQDVDNVKIGGKVCLRARLRNHDNQVIPVSEFPGLRLRAKLHDQGWNQRNRATTSKGR